MVENSTIIGENNAVRYGIMVENSTIIGENNAVRHDILKIMSCLRHF